VRNLVDFQNSVVGHLERFDAIAAYLAAGDNVGMLANHQTEADPGARRRPHRSPGRPCVADLSAPRSPSRRGRGSKASAGLFQRWFVSRDRRRGQRG